METFFHYLQSIKFWTNFINNFPDGLEIEIWWSGAVEHKTEFDLYSVTK